MPKYKYDSSEIERERCPDSSSIIQEERAPLSLQLSGRKSGIRYKTTENSEAPSKMRLRGTAESETWCNTKGGTRNRFQKWDLLKLREWKTGIPKLQEYSLPLKAFDTKPIYQTITLGSRPRKIQWESRNSNWYCPTFSYFQLASRSWRN